MRLFLKRMLYFSMGIAPFFLMIIAYNLVVDPYGVIIGNMEKQVDEPNQHYLKTKHLLQNPEKYDSYFLGSSRVGKIDTRNIDDNNHWYNLSYSEAVPNESLQDLNILLNNGVKIKNIIMGLDDISYQVSPNRHLSESMRKPYANCSLYSYLVLRPSSVERLRNKFNDKKEVFYDIYNSGLPIVLNHDDWINSHKELHINSRKFSIPTYFPYYSNRINETIIEIEEIIKICDKNKISLTLFINPMHISTYLNLDIDEYLEFLNLLVKLKPFYDFSGVNKITSNNYNYYETSHFRPHIGEMMKSDILNNGNKISTFITVENFNDMMRLKRKKFKMHESTNKL
ncbi:hypothetical protein D9V96_010410 [Zobellia laminariae]|uniref:hypothetical protein n=1 Tax=Zobellia laminariae TaxID=248906 RepID=UPI0012D95622|nr:hypothetical protein [Zobellia laminariae]